MEHPAVSVVIATRHRPDPLRLTLDTLSRQTRLPEEVIIIDSSEDDRTALLCAGGDRWPGLRIQYERAARPSAAEQRNRGADLATGAIVVFMDDDVELSPEFLVELIAPFATDPRIAGVSGRILNCVYVQPRGLHWLLLALIVGDTSPSWAGRVVGPAVNFLPDGERTDVHPVDWLFTTGVAYRREVFAQYRFGAFTGYSFAEDVHLSTRVGRDWTLVNAPRATFLHHDMGRKTHSDWRALGESMVVNRYEIMARVLGRDRWIDRVRLALFEVGYGTLTWLLGKGWQLNGFGPYWDLLAGKWFALLPLVRRLTGTTRVVRHGH